MQCTYIPRQFNTVWCGAVSGKAVRWMGGVYIIYIYIYDNITNIIFIINITDTII